MRASQAVYGINKLLLSIRTEGTNPFFSTTSVLSLSKLGVLQARLSGCSENQRRDCNEKLCLFCASESCNVCFSCV